MDIYRIAFLNVGRNDREVITSLLERYQNYTDTQITISEMDLNIRACHLLFVDLSDHKKEIIAKVEQFRLQNSALLVVALVGMRLEFKTMGVAHCFIKPMIDTDFFLVMDRLFSEVLASHYYLDSTSRLTAEETIVCAVSDHRKMKFTTTEGIFYSAETFLDWSYHFRRSSIVVCKRGYLVNLKYIREVGPRFILLENGLKIPVSRRLRDSVIHRLITYQQE